MIALRTLNDSLFDALENHPKPNAFSRKIDGEYRDVSTAEYVEAVTETGLGLVALGLEAGDRVALLSETRYEWAVADMGILSAGLVSVPIYPTLPSLAVEYILENSGARVVMVSHPDHIRKMTGFLRDHPDSKVVIFDPGEANTEPRVMHLDQLRDRGRDLGHAEPELHRRRADAVVEGDVATIIYTSGTTGIPKGVILTHRNLVSNMVAVVPLLTFYPTDNVLSFLPLSHILARLADYALFHAGATIAYAESLETVPQNLQEVRPTIMVSVPRMYEKMFARVQEAARAGGGLKAGLFRWACSVGDRAVDRTQAGKAPGFALSLQNSLAGKLVFAKLHQRLGGRVRVLVSGGAPLPLEVARFFASAGLPILEGYGLSETSPVLAINTPENFRIGTVGKPIPGVRIRIAEDGEILAKGPNIMPGYYKMPEATEEAFVEGWFRTGDIGHLDEDGFLLITDRKKDLLVTAGGKNVPPQPIENSFRTDAYIAEAVVLGDRRPYLVALLVPEYEAVTRVLHIAESDPELLSRDPRVVEFMTRRINRYQRESASFETIKRIALLSRPFTIEDGELTPTLKVKRKTVAERYADRVEELYASGNS